MAIGSFAAAFFPYWRHAPSPEHLVLAGAGDRRWLGYLLTAINIPPARANGRPAGGILSGLARPLPLDYASLGKACALLGLDAAKELARTPVAGGRGGGLSRGNPTPRTACRGYDRPSKSLGSSVSLFLPCPAHQCEKTLPTSSLR